MVRGVLITFEGGEGAGKTTQMTRLADKLTSAGFSVVTLREPGCTTLGEAVRELLLSPHSDGLSMHAELLLYEACRAQLVDEVIRPALSIGRVVLVDRFYDSTVAYQGYGRGIPLKEIEHFNEFSSRGLRPDLTVVLDVDPRVGIERATRSGADRLEAEELAFHERVRDGFLAAQQAEPQRVKVIDAERDVETIAEEAWELVSALPVIATAVRQRA